MIEVPRLRIVELAVLVTGYVISLVVCVQVLRQLFQFLSGVPSGRWLALVSPMPINESPTMLRQLEVLDHECGRKMKWLKRLSILNHNARKLR